MKTRYRLLAAATVAALAGGAAASEASAVDVGKAKRQHPIVRQVKTTRPVVYLTFDDGPSKYTPQVVSTLKRYGARATFFQLGSEARRYPAITKMVRRSGNKVAGHSYSHPMLTKRSNSSILSELRRTDAAIGFKPRCMRPPYGSINARVHGQIALHGQTPILWNVDTRDWAKPGQPYLRRQIQRVRPGSIVLMHDGGGNRSQTLQLLRWAIPNLKKRGYQVQPLPMC